MSTVTNTTATGSFSWKLKSFNDKPGTDPLIEELHHNRQYLYAAQLANTDRPIFIFAESRTAAWARARGKGIAIALRPLTLAQERAVIDGNTPRVTFDPNDVLE